MEEMLTSKQVCYHCGDACEDIPVLFEDKSFCCQGCKTVYEILNEHALCDYYRVGAPTPGQTLKSKERTPTFDWLNTPEVRQNLIDFSEGNVTRVTFFLPQIHCSSCIWLLENLPRLHDGIHHSRVQFLRKEVIISFDESQLRLSDLVSLLDNIGYEPDLRLKDITQKSAPRSHKRLIFQLGIAGFCFGNIMLLSFPEYLSMSKLTSEYATFFGYLNIILSLPVFLYSATDYFKSAYYSLREKHLNIDVPISLGIITLFGRSVFEILTHTGAGYLDSLAGLVFFLLVGKWFQNKTYNRLAFDREYTSYFPISILKKTAEGEKSVPVTQLREGDQIIVKNGEVIPADAILLSDETHIDYSFVTGESHPVTKHAGEVIYAGGRQTGASASLQLIRRVEQSYLTQLWEDSSTDSHTPRIATLADRLGKRFTLIILVIAFIAGIGWWLATDMGQAVNIFTAVLIVACPCALALSAPIGLGNALRMFGHNQLYLKNTDVIESMARIDHIVFDKTGTITYNDSLPAEYHGQTLNSTQRAKLRSLCRESNHPVSQSIYRWCGKGESLYVSQFHEHVGEGVEGYAGQSHMILGNHKLINRFVEAADEHLYTKFQPSATHLVIDKQHMGHFVMKDDYRKGWGDLLQELGKSYELSLLTGDNDLARPYLTRHMPRKAEMRFFQSPFDKRDYISSLQSEGHHVMMIGDGLNDAGALKQSDVGLAISENVNNFSPACDGILNADQFRNIGTFVSYAKKSLNLVKLSYILSLGYNVIGLTIAIQGLLSPVIAAILMPLSSISVVLFATGATYWTARKMGLNTRAHTHMVDANV